VLVNHCDSLSLKNIRKNKQTSFTHTRKASTIYDGVVECLCNRTGILSSSARVGVLLFYCSLWRIQIWFAFLLKAHFALPWFKGLSNDWKNSCYAF